MAEFYNEIWQSFFLKKKKKKPRIQVKEYANYKNMTLIIVLHVCGLNPTYHSPPIYLSLKGWEWYIEIFGYAVFNKFFFPLKIVGPHQCDSYLASIFNLLFSENRIQFSLYKHKNRETSFRWFQKTQNQFSDNLVNKLRSCEVHNMCCLNQTQRIHVSLTLKISPKQ